MSHRGADNQNFRPRLKLVPGSSALPPASRRQPHPPRTLAIASGKGGVGKTCLAVNLALALSDLGTRVLVVDGDLGLGKVDVLLGTVPPLDLSHYLGGQCSLQDVITVGPAGVSFLPAGSGHGDLAVLDAVRRERLLGALVGMTGRFDLVLLDLPSGIGPNTLELARLSDEVIVVATPEPTSCTDAYAVIKQLHRSRSAEVRIVINRARAWTDAQSTYARIARTAGTHLGAAPGFLGFVPEDPAVQQAVLDQRPFVVNAPSAPSTLRVRELAWRVLSEEPPGGGDRINPGLRHQPTDHPAQAA